MLKRLRTCLGAALSAACVLLWIAPAFGQNPAADETTPDAARRVTILYLGENDDRPGTKARFDELVALLRRLDADPNVEATRQIYSPYKTSAVEGETVGEATSKNLLDALIALEDFSGDSLELRLLLVLPVEREYFDNKTWNWRLAGSENLKWSALESAILCGRHSGEPVCDLKNFQRVFAAVDLLTCEPTANFFSELKPTSDEEGASLGYVCLDSLAPANYLTLVKNCLEAKSARLKASLTNGDLTLFDAVEYIATNGFAASATTLKSAVSDDAKLVLFGENYPLVPGVVKNSVEDKEGK